MKKMIRLTESDLLRVIRQIIEEQNDGSSSFQSKVFEIDSIIKNLKSQIQRNISTQGNTRKGETNEQTSTMSFTEKYKLFVSIQDKLVSSGNSCERINEYNSLTVLSSDISVRIENGTKIQKELISIMENLRDISQGFTKLN
jgi:hypothetical protein